MLGPRCPANSALAGVLGLQAVWLIASWHRPYFAVLNCQIKAAKRRPTIMAGWPGGMTLESVAANRTWGHAGQGDGVARATTELNKRTLIPWICAKCTFLMYAMPLAAVERALVRVLQPGLLNTPACRLTASSRGSAHTQPPNATH